jgi:hypothetical protein
MLAVRKKINTIQRIEKNVSDVPKWSPLIGMEKKNRRKLDIGIHGGGDGGFYGFFRGYNSDIIYLKNFRFPESCYLHPFIFFFLRKYNIILKLAISVRIDGDGFCAI